MNQNDLEFKFSNSKSKRGACAFNLGVPKSSALKALSLAVVQASAFPMLKKSAAKVKIANC